MTKHLYLFFIGILAFTGWSCDKKDSTCCAPSSVVVVFGHFYGFCIGEQCIEIFKLEGNLLYEDTNDTYPESSKPYEGNYIALSGEKYELVKDLMDYFPESLFDESATILGMPDAGDWGGAYFEMQRPGETRRFWLLDQHEGNMPQAYNAFVDKINEKIGLINQ